MANIFTKLKELIYPTPPAPTLSPEEAKAVADKVEQALLTMRSNCSWSQVEVNAAINMCRTFPKGTPRHDHYRRVLKLRLVMQQYMEKICMTMESVSSQIKLAQLTSEMGNALQNATTLVNTYKRDMPSFSGFVRKFLETIAPMNQELGGGLDEFAAAMDQLTGCTLDGVFSETDLDALIEGTVSSVEPVIPQAPVQAAPTQAPAAKVDEYDDLLASLERQLPMHPVGGKTE